MASVSDNNEQIERGIKMMEYQDQSLRGRVFQRLREDILNGNSYYRQSEAESPDPAAGRMAIRI